MSESQGLKIGVFGATGAVGREIVSVLGERKFPVSELRLFASNRSIGTELDFAGKDVPVDELTEDFDEKLDIAFFSAGSQISEQYAPRIAELGAVVIDNSSCFRMHDDIALVVPEVNGDLVTERVKAASGGGFIIANPNCSTIQLVVALAPLHRSVGIKRVVVSTYQSVSGAGQAGISELTEQVQSVYNQRELVSEKFPRTIAFNCLPHIDDFLDSGYTKEEMKIVNETKKILGDQEIRVTATAVRVPVYYSHSESVSVELNGPMSAEQAREVLAESPGVLLHDGGNGGQYPTPLEVAGTDATYVGRIRQDESVEHGLNLWVVADNVRKGAALNAVQIAEKASENL